MMVQHSGGEVSLQRVKPHSQNDAHFAQVCLCTKLRLCAAFAHSLQCLHILSHHQFRKPGPLLIMRP